MSEKKQTDIDANSPEFIRGVEAGLNSEDTKYWQAGYELGQQLADRDTKELVKGDVQKDSDNPLFLRDTLQGHTGDAQDEKDTSAE